MKDYTKSYKNREMRELWTTSDYRAVQVQGFSCKPENPDYWWCPELGFSISEKHHVFKTESDAWKEVVGAIDREMVSLENHRNAALVALLTSAGIFSDLSRAQKGLESNSKKSKA